MSPLVLSQNAIKEQKNEKNLIRPMASTAELSLRGKIREMLNFVLENAAIASEAQMEQYGKTLNMSELVTVYNILLSKYISTGKTKEEMVKYILRKALKSMKQSIKKREKLDDKKAEEILCKRYFNSNAGSFKSMGLDDNEGEDDGQGGILPFKKNSKNKTMNNSFLAEIFSSDDFCKEYVGFLEVLEKQLKDDNVKKVEKFVHFIEDCLERNSIKEIAKYKRIPWLKSWINKTKNLANDLTSFSKSEGLKKKVKLEGSDSEKFSGLADDVSTSMDGEIRV